MNILTENYNRGELQLIKKKTRPENFHEGKKKLYLTEHRHLFAKISMVFTAYAEIADLMP